MTLADATPKSALELAIEAIGHGAIQKPNELASLVSLLRRRAGETPLRTVVEVGTQVGGTFWLWCQLAEPDALLVSIDLPGGIHGGGATEEQVEVIRGYARERQTLEFLLTDSHDPATRAELQRILDGREVDLLMIDGDHTYDGVRQDYLFYAPLVAEGGLIAFHDIVPHPTLPEVRVHDLWPQLRQGASEAQDIVDETLVKRLGRWGGLGILTHRRSEYERFAAR